MLKLNLVHIMNNPTPLDNKRKHFGVAQFLQPLEIIIKAMKNQSITESNAIFLQSSSMSMHSTNDFRLNVMSELSATQIYSDVRSHTYLGPRCYLLQVAHLAFLWFSKVSSSLWPIPEGEKHGIKKERQ